MCTDEEAVSCYHLSSMIADNVGIVHQLELLMGVPLGKHGVFRWWTGAMAAGCFQLSVCALYTTDKAICKQSLPTFQKLADLLKHFPYMQVL